MILLNEAEEDALAAFIIVAGPWASSRLSAEHMPGFLAAQVKLIKSRQFRIGAMEVALQDQMKGGA
ncbi:MAG: hypothetical protein KA105_02685 [Caulobacter sp.]|nr:hypothetical protein [Caulobacter sp.]